MYVSEVVYYDFDEFRLDLKRQQLLKNGEPVLLTNKAFQTLHILVQNFGQIVEKEDIYKELWTDSFVEEANLTQYIYLLRKILAKNPAGVSYIETVARRGYIFNAQVEKSFAPEPTQKAHFPTHSFEANRHTPAVALKFAPEPAIQPDFLPLRLVKGETEKAADLETDKLIMPPDGFPKKVQRSGWSSRFLSLVILLSTISLASLGLLIYLQPDDSSTRTTPGISSLAVLPFQPIGEESRDSKLGFGMADAIITRLSSLQKIEVRPTSSVYRYIDEPAAGYAAAGAELGVEAILEGTVQRDGDRVRVSVQLFNVADGKALWAEKFDEKYVDVFSLQDSIASKIASSLALKLTPQQWKLLEQRLTSKPEALEAYQMGVFFWNTRTKENLQKAEANFQKAVEIDPNFATAHAMLADTYNMLGYYRFADRAEMRSKASAATNKALSLDDSVAEAHIANAFLQFTPTGVDAAKKSIERAIELAPYNSTARLRHAWILLRKDRLDDAVAEVRLARDYDPLSPVSNGALCNMLTYRENFAEAVGACRKSVELSPDTADNRLALANTLFLNGETDEAIAQAKLYTENGKLRFAALGSIGFYYAKLGRRSEAETILAQLTREAEKDPMLLIDLTLIEYALGNRDKSFVHFQKGYEKRVISAMNFHIDPLWKDVRLDARFANLIKD